MVGGGIVCEYTTCGLWVAVVFMSYIYKMDSAKRLTHIKQNAAAWSPLWC